MILSEKIIQRIEEVRGDLSIKGDVLSKSQIEQYSKTFRDRFGPEKLNSIDGETLLDTMHNHSNPDSLVYWLEFKNDEEMPGPKFGSISGGSALKFGIYRRKETGIWMTGSPQKQQELEITDAVNIARRHRAQLTKGFEILEKLPHDPTDNNYFELQQKMEQDAPDINNTGWGHKYFSLLFTNKLDDYHNQSYQRFFLIKLLQTPPKHEGRYVCAGRYIKISNELGIPAQNLTSVLYSINGRPHRYWRIGTKLGGSDSRWSLMKEHECVTVGYAKMCNLNGLEYKSEDKEKIRSQMASKYPEKAAQSIGRHTQQLFKYVTVIKEGDIVIPSDGETVLGVGRVDGEYFFVENSDAPHRIPVKWLSFDEWKIHQREGLETTIYEIKKTENLIETEKMISEAKPITLPPIRTIDPIRKAISIKLTGIPGRIQATLERKGQVILYGPPGTGKTYWANKATKELASQNKFGKSYENLSEKELAKIHGNTKDSQGLIRICTFHPAYGYEDFIEGYRPKTLNDQMVFELRDGILKKLCKDAIKDPENKYYLIIDEINRGDIPRIFGEILTIMEKDKRGFPLLLSNSGTSFYLPTNVYLLGTMNTADRSIALLDTALRRRFGFIELMPDISVLGNTVVEGIPLGPWLAALNSKICEYIGRDARNLQIGHAYLLNNGKPVNKYNKLVQIMQDDILPLIEEYCYEDYATIHNILGKSIVDEQNQRLRTELFELTRKDEFVQALKAIDPNLDSSPAALLSEAESPEEDEPNELEQENNNSEKID